MSSFPRAAVVDVRLVRRSKSTAYTIALIDRRGAETTLAPSSNVRDLDQMAQRAQAYFVDRRVDSLVLEEPRPVVPLGLGVVLFGASLAIVVTSFRGRGARRVVIDDRRITIGNASFVRPDVASIEVERGTIPDRFKSRSQPDEPAGRVVFVGDDGARTALTERLLPGTDVHEQMAAKLRDVFGLAPPSPKAVSFLERAPTASTPWKIVVTLVAGGFALSGAATYLLRSRAAGPNASEGTLEVNCTNRCKFQGMECMPGGSWSSTMPPGDYTFEVYDPTAQSQWTKRTVTIRKGQTTVFACTPR